MKHSRYVELKQKMEKYEVIQERIDECKEDISSLLFGADDRFQISCEYELSATKYAGQEIKESIIGIVSKQLLAYKKEQLALTLEGDDCENQEIGIHTISFKSEDKLGVHGEDVYKFLMNNRLYAVIDDVEREFELVYAKEGNSIITVQYLAYKEEADLVNELKSVGIKTLD